MAGRGIFMSLDEGQVRAVQDATRNDARLVTTLHEIEEAWDEPHIQEVDKAWDAMHRCLSDGTLDPNGGAPPLNMCVLGGRQLHRGPGYIVSFLDREQVKEVAQAVAHLSEDWFRQRYFSLKVRPSSYEGPLDEDDFQYTWTYFELVRDFYARAAVDGRAMTLLVSQ